MPICHVQNCNHKHLARGNICIMWSRSGILPIRRSAWDFPMLTNSCWRNCNKFCFEVSPIKRLMSRRSTAEGWYFVSIGTGGITSVRLVNIMVTFLLHKKKYLVRQKVAENHGDNNIMFYLPNASSELTQPKGCKLCKNKREAEAENNSKRGETYSVDSETNLKRNWE